MNDSGNVSRRSLVAAGPLALAACGRAEETYFGKTAPPHTKRLVYLFEAEPGSLDPPLSMGRMDQLILSLFEGLTGVHPITGAPIAALATHYDVTPDRLRCTFRLRGHPQPRGMRLPNTGDLPREFSRDRTAPLDITPARWSDGTPITAHDFVYSWRRAVDPVTAAERAFMLDYIENGQEITAGKLPPERLAVRALNDFTFQVDLRTPAPFFLELVSGRMFCPVPRHAIQAAGRGWTEPGRMVSSGAFTLKERRPYDRIVLARNPRYYESGQVALEEVAFLIVVDPTAMLNLYKAGVGAVTQPNIPTIIPTLRRRKDFRPQRYYASGFIAFNTTTPPLNEVCVRYALNMASDKRPIADLAGAGSVPALGLVPPTEDYPAPRTLPVSIDGTTYDVLSFNPRAARQLLSKAATRFPDRLEYFAPNFPDCKLWAQVLKAQWKAHLGVELVMVAVEPQVWVQSFYAGNFRHVAQWGSEASYVDPVWFLDAFNSPGGYGTGWSDPVYSQLLSRAQATSDPALRMGRLAECERRLLQAMPIIPQLHDVYPRLAKPFVRGLGSNLLNREQLKYAWIDTQWRPQ